MKIASTIARYLLGAIFFLFGLNGFLHFLPSSPPPGIAGQFVGALFISHYLHFVFLVQLVSAVLLLANRYVALALVLVGPVIVNILLFHVTMAPAGLPLALVVAVLWIFTALSVHTAFLGILQQRATS